MDILITTVHIIKTYTITCQKRSQWQMF